ncbi:FAD-binding oxidoreductase [Streptomyces cucumeris]|uniref:FAD-binding oxidoreductase n=1 Tax=Streptomyces cucumeris TaxID=2962890 RepID=UPI003EB7ACEA
MSSTLLPPDSRGRELWCGEADYETARRDAVWNARKPDRGPDLIVQAASEQDVSAAMDYARGRGMRVAVRAGGHSLWGSALREGGMLIDLSRMREVSIDPRQRTATLEPGVTALDLATALAEHGLAFPVGHCATVALSGYLLAGGLGWNLGTWGPACSSLESLELVTAEGELVTADAHHHADLFWAARGSGTGFFGVATRFTVRLYPAPPVIRTSSTVHPLTAAPAVGAWLDRVAPVLPDSVELRVLIRANAPATGSLDGTGSLEVSAIAFGDSAGEADRSLHQVFHQLMAETGAARAPHATTTLPGLLDASPPLLPEGRRYSGDALWSDAPVGDLLHHIARAAADAPSDESVILVCPSPPLLRDGRLPDAAFSMTGKTLVLPYAIWADETADQRNREWLSALTTTLGPLTHGHYVGEADLAHDPSRSVRSFAPANWERLRALRAVHDPQGIFHSFPGMDGQPR